MINNDVLLKRKLIKHLPTLISYKHYIGVFLVMTCLPNIALAACTQSDNIDMGTEQTEPLSEHSPNKVSLASDVAPLEQSDYQKAKAYQLMVRPLAVQPNHVLAKKYIALQQTLETELMRKDFLSPKNSLTNSPKNKTDMSDEDKEAISQLFQLARASYIGEVIPKNDNDAVRYIKKVVQYFHTDEKTGAYLEFKFLMSLDLDSISDANPIKQQTDNETLTQISALFLAAGSVPSKINLLMNEFYQLRNPQKQQMVLNELRRIAERGSNIAVDALVEINREQRSIDTQKKSDK